VKLQVRSFPPDRNSHLYHSGLGNGENIAGEKDAGARAGSSSVNVGRQLQDTETGYGRRSRSFVRKAVQAELPMPPQLERIRRLDSRCGSSCAAARRITRKICNVDAATLRERASYRPAAGGLQNGRKRPRLRARLARCNQLLAALIHFSEKRLNQRKKPGCSREVDEMAVSTPTGPPPRSAIKSHEAVLAHMFRRVNSSPVLFAQPLRSRIDRVSAFQSITQKMSNLLSDRSVADASSSLELSVERVGEVFDVQNCHRFLLNSSIMEELSAICQGHCWRQKIRKCLRHVVPATSGSFWLRRRI